MKLVYKPSTVDKPTAVAMGFLAFNSVKIPFYLSV